MGWSGRKSGGVSADGTESAALRSVNEGNGEKRSVSSSKKTRGAERRTHGGAGAKSGQRNSVFLAGSLILVGLFLGLFVGFTLLDADFEQIAHEHPGLGLLLGD